MDQLPLWVNEPWQWQVDAVKEIIDAYTYQDARVVFLDAPTGSGKTLIAEMVRRELHTRMTYVCHGKSLQDQFLKDFPYAHLLKGRANYVPTNAPRLGTGKNRWEQITCADCTSVKGSDCDWCADIDTCPYGVARSAALRADVAVLNTSYLLNEANYIGRWSKREFVVADECDTLEDELLKFVEFRALKGLLEKAGIEAPIKGAHKARLIGWLDDYIVACRDYAAHVPNTVDGLRDQVRWRRSASDAEGIKRELQVDENKDIWIRDNDAGPLVMKPVTANKWGSGYLWRHGKMWLCMSASIISVDEMRESLGVPDEWNVATVTVPMRFNKEHRPIIIAPVANVINSNLDVATEKLKVAVSRIATMHPDERILVHTVNYRLARELSGEDYGRPVFTYSSARERDAAIANYRRHERSIIFAPSLDRGFDFKDDDCRVSVIVKVPFGNVGDRQVSARLHLRGGQVWYTVQAIRRIIQMSGRGVRHENDYAVTYILDQQFTKNLWSKNKRLFPEWWREAVDMSFPVRSLL